MPSPTPPNSASGEVLDVAPQAAWIDNAFVARGLGLALGVVGLSVLGVGLLMPPLDVWQGLGGLLMVLLAAAWLRWVRRVQQGHRSHAFAAVLTLFGVLLLIEAGLHLRPDFQWPDNPLFPLREASHSAMAMLNSQSEAWNWWLARAIAALFSLVVAGNLFLLALRTWRLPHPLASPPAPGAVTPVLVAPQYFQPMSQGVGRMGAWLAALLELPPAVARMLQPSTWQRWPFKALGLMLGATLAWAVALANAAWAMNDQGLRAVNAALSCLDTVGSSGGPDMAACVAEQGDVAVYGMLWMALGFLLLFPWLGDWAWRRGEKSMIDLADAELKGWHPGAGCGVLFLRSFGEDEKVKLRPPGWTPWNLLVHPWVQKAGNTYLDQLLLLELGVWRLPVALAEPKNRTQPDIVKTPTLGSLRKYAPDDSPNTPLDETQWAQLVRQLAHEAQLIVLVLDSTVLNKDPRPRGIHWELEQLKQTALRKKALLLVHPDLSTDISRVALWKKAAELANFSLPEELDTDRLLGFMLQASGAHSPYFALLGKTWGHNEYRLALRAAANRIQRS